MVTEWYILHVEICAAGSEAVCSALIVSCTGDLVQEPCRVTAVCRDSRWNSLSRAVVV